MTEKTVFYSSIQAVNKANALNKVASKDISFTVEPVIVAGFPRAWMIARWQWVRVSSPIDPSNECSFVGFWSENAEQVESE